jgi:hypothetical protein
MGAKDFFISRARSGEVLGQPGQNWYHLRANVYSLRRIKRTARSADFSDFRHKLGVGFFETRKSLAGKQMYYIP